MGTGAWAGRQAETHHRRGGAAALIPQPSSPLAWDCYAYARNNPLRYTDPSGHFSQDEIMKVFNKEKWEDVEKLFQKGGELEGRWGWLSILQKAEVGDKITLNWDQSLLPEGHLPIDNIFIGKFDIDQNGHLIITGKDNFMDQMKAAKYGLDYELTHYEDNNGKRFAAAFLLITTDLFVGLPAFGCIISGNPVAMKAGEFIETTVVIPVNILAVKMWSDADNEIMENYLIPAKVEQKRRSIDFWKR